MKNQENYELLNYLFFVIFPGITPLENKFPPKMTLTQLP